MHLAARPNDDLSHASQPSLIRPFYPALDGLRAIAFLVVFSFHYIRNFWDDEVWRWGWVGVDLFFALSGFLITGILYDSLQRNDYFKGFYIRRSLRIFPLYYGFFLALLLLTPLLHVQWHLANLAMVFYVGNFFIPGGLMGHHMRPDLLLFTIPWLRSHPHMLLMDQFWTLCVEEQFYLVWPAVLWFVRTRQTLLRLCLGLLVLFPLLRTAYLLFAPDAINQMHHGMLYWNTFARADALIAGAAIALWLRGPAAPLPSIRRAALFMTFGAPILLVVLFILKPQPQLSVFEPMISTIGFSLVAVTASGVLLLALERESYFTSALQARPLVKMGRLTYGMYFYHNLFFPDFAAHSVWARSHHVLFLVPVFALAATYIVATLSFRLLESPFLRLKSRYAPRPNAVSDPFPV